MKKEKKNSKLWVLLIFLVLLLLLLLAFCSRKRSVDLHQEQEQSQQEVLQSTKTVVADSEKTTPVVIEATIEPTALPPLGEITILSPVPGEKIPAYDYMGNQAGGVSWFLGPGDNFSNRRGRDEWHEHYLIWEEYPGADYYDLRSRICGENENYAAYSGEATSEDCQNGICTHSLSLGLPGPPCGKNVAVVVLAYEDSIRGLLIGVGHVTVETYWTEATAKMCETRICLRCPTSLSPPLEEWIRLEREKSER